MSENTEDILVGRREYDKLRADYIVVSNQLSTVIAKFTEFQVDVKAELTAIRLENKELLGVWNTAKGTSSFIMWLSKLLIAAGIITAFFKWGPLK